MKITYNKLVQRYVVSELGTILHTTPCMTTAMRLAGMEPEPICEASLEDEDDDFDALLELCK